MSYVVLTATAWANIGKILDFIFYENVFMCCILHLRYKTEHRRARNTKFVILCVLLQQTYAGV